MTDPSPPVPPIADIGEALDCPFCGARLIADEAPGHSTFWGHPMSDEPSTCWLRHEAIGDLEAWNTRTPSAREAKLIEEIIETLKDCISWLDWCVDMHDAPDPTLEAAALARARKTLAAIRKADRQAIADLKGEK